MQLKQDLLRTAMGQQILILQKLATGAPLIDILSLIAEAITHRCPDSTVLLSRLDSSSQTLTVQVSLRCPASLLETLVPNSAPIGPKTTPCAEAALFGRPIIIVDIRKEPYWEHLRGLLEAYGLLSCISIPVFDSKSNVLGTFSLYHRTPSEPAEELLKILQVHAYVAGLAVEKHEMDQHLHRIIYFDDLTGLPNKKHFFEQVDRAVTQSTTDFFVMKIDLDEFQSVTDGLDFTIRDEVLKIVAHRLQACVSDHDGVLARIDSHTFSALFLNTNSNQAVHLANLLLKMVSQPVQLDHVKLYLTASIGLASGKEDGPHAEALHKNVDIAMNCARKSYGNQFRFYDVALMEHIEQRLSLMHELHVAIENEDIFLHFQPRVHLKSGFLSAEALARWNHPVRGNISPDKFIPLAESTGQIVPLGWLVLRKTCRQIRQWLDNGIQPVRIGINVSASQFGPELIVQVHKALNEYQIEPKWLEIEITESVLMQHEKIAIETLDALKQMGIQISLDDFGTGYSSLGFLQHFHVDTLKIDRSFVQGATQNPQAAAIVYAILDLGKNLGLHIIAEGVETEEQLNFLKLKGCQEVQGFLFYGPLSAEEFQRLLMNRPSL